MACMPARRAAAIAFSLINPPFSPHPTQPLSASCARGRGGPGLLGRPPTVRQGGWTPQSLVWPPPPPPPPPWPGLAWPQADAAGERPGPPAVPTRDVATPADARARPRVHRCRLLAWGTGAALEGRSGGGHARAAWRRGEGKGGEAGEVEVEVEVDRRQGGRPRPFAAFVRTMKPSAGLRIASRLTIVSEPTTCPEVRYTPRPSLPLVASYGLGGWTEGSRRRLRLAATAADAAPRAGRPPGSPRRLPLVLPDDRDAGACEATGRVWSGRAGRGEQGPPARPPASSRPLVGPSST